jgi:tRNA A37 N6-isopentenylltransferase MiaA
VAIVTNKDIEVMVDVEELLHKKVETEEETELWTKYWNIVERFIVKKKEIAKRQNNWNKNNREYHRITNNISTNKKSGNKEKEQYWRNKLKEFKENDSK